MATPSTLADQPELELGSVPPPLARWHDGSVRVGGTRLLLDMVVIAYNRGDSAEAIADSFAMPIEPIIGTLSFYFANREAVDALIARNEEEAERFLDEVEREHPQEGLKARLLARRAEREATANRFA